MRVPQIGVSGMLNSSLPFSLSVSPLLLSASVSLVGYGNRAQKLPVRSGPHIGGLRPASGGQTAQVLGVSRGEGTAGRGAGQLVEKPSQVPSAASEEPKPRKP